MIAKIIDNQFDQQYLYNIYQALNDELDYKANNIANRKTWPFGDSGSHRLLGCTLFEHPNSLCEPLSPNGHVLRLAMLFAL